MRIGVITSGFEMLPLFKFMNKYDFEYKIIRDWNNRPYGDKGFDFSLSRIKERIQLLEKKGVDFIIVPPVYELFIENPKILPLFRRYLFQDCLKNSLVGKIGFLGDFSDNEVIEQKFYEITSDYQLTKNQQNTRKFHFPFAVWKKELPLWKYYLIKLGFRNRMVRKTIKSDIRYFKDADVDTLVPLNRGFLAYDKIIRSHINTNRIRFYGMEKLEKIFEELVQENQISQEEYGINIYSNGTSHFLLEDKKRKRLLERGKEISINLEYL